MTNTAKKTTPPEKVASTSLPRLKEQESGTVLPGESPSENPNRVESPDNEAISILRESIKEAELAEPQVKLSPDLEDAGVISPQQEADAVLEKGPTLNLDITKEKLEEGSKMSAGGKSDKQKTVFGVIGLAALAIWVKRAIKLAHKHTMKIVFRKPHSVESDSTSRGKEEKNAN